jgi:tetratricopeptide (TPR) repeat protein
MVGQALRGGLATTDAVEGFVAALRAGEAQLEGGEDAALGRSRSLAASLSYGFAGAFNEAERAQLAVLHLFRDTAYAVVLHGMGNQEVLEEDAVPELVPLDGDAAVGLLDRAAAIGLLESLGAGSGYYQIHPALPWYFTSLFTDSYGSSASPAAHRAARAYARALGALGDYYHDQAGQGHESWVVPVLGVEEANLRHALTLARTGELWHAAAGCLQGLRTLYERTGRDGEWARLVAAVTPDVTDPATGGPLPGRDEQWGIITGYRVRLARRARDWPAATTLQTALIAWARDRAAAALAASPASLTSDQRNQIRNLAASLHELAQILLSQQDPGCLPYYQEALGLFERIGARPEQADLAVNLGNAYLQVPGLRDLGQAEHWYKHGLSLRTDSNQLGQAGSLSQLGNVALERFNDAQDAGEAAPVLVDHLNAALGYYQQALDLTPADDHEHRAVVENQLGVVYAGAGDTGQALRHFQQALRHHEARGDIYTAGEARRNIALLLERDGRISDALLFARAALANFQQAGPGAADRADRARRHIARLEQPSR